MKINKDITLERMRDLVNDAYNDGWEDDDTFFKIYDYDDFEDLKKSNIDDGRKLCSVCRVRKIDTRFESKTESYICDECLFKKKIAEKGVIIK